MSKVTERYKKQQKKSVIGMLRGLVQKIEKEEVEVTNHGFWPAGTYDKYIFRVDVKDSRNSEESGNNE
jgi:hypothetical protein